VNLIRSLIQEGDQTSSLWLGRVRKMKTVNQAPNARFQHTDFGLFEVCLANGGRYRLLFQTSNSLDRNKHLACTIRLNAKSI